MKRVIYKTRYRVKNGIVKALTQRDDAVRVNMVMTDEVQAKKLESDGQPKQSRWGFITDLEVSFETATEIGRIGRSRWKIENEVFKTLKSDEAVRLGRNYGHGRKHLMDVLTPCMLMAFQFDQLQAIGSTEFQEARTRKQGRLSYLWRTMAEKVRGVPLGILEHAFRAHRPSGALHSLRIFGSAKLLTAPQSDPVLMP